MSNLLLLLPLLAAILYVFGALATKRAGDEGVDPWRLTFVANWAAALCFSALWLFGGTVHWDRLWEPALTGVMYLAGQLLAFLSLDRGDISVATPVLSLKIILVALFSTLVLGAAVPLPLWAAAGLSTLGVALLSRNPGGTRHEKREVLMTVLLAFLAAAAFAFFDVLVMKWSPAWGMGAFLPMMLYAVVLLTPVLIPRFPAPLKALPGSAWRWVLSGSALIAVQSLIFVSSLALSGNGTGANVVYATRGLFSVLMVWLLARIGGGTTELDRATLLYRLAGAACITAAVALALLH